MFVKTVGVASALGTALSSLKNRISIAFIYGSVASATETEDSDIDLMVIGDAGFAEVVSAIRPAQDETGREVNPTVYSPSEFSRKVEEKEAFIADVLEGEKIFIRGDENELEELVGMGLGHKA